MSVHLNHHAFKSSDALAWPYSSADFVICVGKRFVRIGIPHSDDLSEIVELQAREIGPTASLETTQAVYAINPDSFRVFWDVSSPDKKPEIAGFASFLFLSEEGRAELEAGTFVGRTPHLDTLAKQGVRPAATYAWALVARGFGGLAVKHAALSYQPDTYRGVPVWCTAASDAGAKLINAEGFDSQRNGRGVGGVFKTDRPAVLQGVAL